MIDANLVTSFDYHHLFPSFSSSSSLPLLLPLLLLPPVSHTRTKGSGSNSIHHAAKINDRQKETELGD